tara:strand:- start:8 stop:640 length:633 start_codon:yes stop_codon:yes gene_type:complete
MSTLICEVDMSTFRRRPRLGSLFWDDDSKNSEGTLAKPIVKLTTIEANGKRLATVTSRFGLTNLDETKKLQDAAGALVAAITKEMENVASTGAFTSIGAWKTGKLISDFVDKNQKHVIVNFTTFLRNETRVGLKRHCSKLYNADATKLIGFYKNFSKKDVINYPDIWRIIGKKLLQLVQASKVKEYFKWYKVNYEKKTITHVKKMDGLLK